MNGQIETKMIDRPSELGGAEPIYYEVFARRTSQDPLTHVGSVEGPNVELAQARAWYVFDEHSWKEMCIAPASAFITLTEFDGRSKIKVV